MEDNFIDFSGASQDDFKIVGSETAASSGEPAATIPPASEPAQAAEPAAAEPAKSPEPVVTPKADAAPEYKFKDDFIKNVVEFYEKTGDLTPYLQAKLVDFNSFSDEEIMRRNLREQYSDLSDKAFDRLYKQQVIEKFKLDSDEFGEEDSELGRELLKTEASKVRQQYLDWQKGFQAPEPAEPAASQDAELMKRFEQDVRTNEVTRSLLESGKLAVKIGDSEFNFEIPNANQVLDMTIDNDKFFSQFANPNGGLDYNRWYKTAVYSQNPELYEKSLANHFRALGREEITREIKNPSDPRVGGVASETGGDSAFDLLSAFASRGIHK